MHARPVGSFPFNVPHRSHAVEVILITPDCARVWRRETPEVEKRFSDIALHWRSSKNGGDCGSGPFIRTKYRSGVRVGPFNGAGMSSGRPLTRWSVYSQHDPDRSDSTGARAPPQAAGRQAFLPPLR